MNKVLVNLVTHSAYSDVCDNFLQLFKKNWKDCPYDFVISIIGDEIHFEGYKCYYFGKESTLPNAIYELMKITNYDYCISFLGDAFINSNINTFEISELMDSFMKGNYEYGCLIPRQPFRLKGKIANKYFRFISNYDIYNMCFVAFIASRNFVEHEFCNGISDLEFEMKYLKPDSDEKIYYDNRVIVLDNFFNLLPGIEAGKWNRKALKKLEKNNPEINFSKRPLVSVSKSYINRIIGVAQIFISKKQRQIFKKIFNRYFKYKFTTDF